MPTDSGTGTPIAWRIVFNGVTIRDADHYVEYLTGKDRVGETRQPDANKDAAQNFKRFVESGSGRFL